MTTLNIIYIYINIFFSSFLNTKRIEEYNRRMQGSKYYIVPSFNKYVMNKNFFHNYNIIENILSIYMIEKYSY